MILITDSNFHHFPVKKIDQEKESDHLIERQGSDFQLIEKIKKIFISIIDVIKSFFTSNYDRAVQNLIQEIKDSQLEESKYLNHEDPDIRDLAQKSSQFVKNLTSNFSNLKNHEKVDLTKEKRKNAAIECFNLIFDYYKDVNKFLKKDGKNFIEADIRIPAIIGNLLSGFPTDKALKIIDSVCDKMIEFYSSDEIDLSLVATEMHAVANYLMGKLGIIQKAS